MAAKDEKADKRSANISASMVEDDATEKLKKRAQDLGLIVNAEAGKADQKKPDNKK